MTDLGRAVAADVEHARQRVPADRIDRQQAHPFAVGHRDSAVRRAEVEAESRLAHPKRMPE
jgi:hypothetical protein